MALPKITWNTHDRMAKKWDAIDAERLTWEMWEIADESIRPPAISGSDGDLGGKCGAFAAAYTAADANPGVKLTVTVSLDNTVIYTDGPAAPPVSGQAVIEARAVAGMAIGSTHTLVIAARDTLGFSAARRYTFTAVEDLRKTAVYYLLRDDIPIARIKGAASLTDYTALGKHRYRVRAVDRYGGFADSNEITLETRVEDTVLAPLARPSEMTRLLYRMDAPPIQECRYEAGTRLYQFEGRSYASLERNGTSGGQWSVTFSAERRAEYDRVLALARESGPVVYRDGFGNRAIVSIDAVPVRFLAVGAEFTLMMTQLEDGEEVPYD